MVKSPRESLVAIRFRPVSSAVSVTATPEIGFPDLSVTCRRSIRPEIEQAPKGSPVAELHR